MGPGSGSGTHGPVVCSGAAPCLALAGKERHTRTVTCHPRRPLVPALGVTCRTDNRVAVRGGHAEPTRHEDNSPSERHKQEPGSGAPLPLRPRRPCHGMAWCITPWSCTGRGLAVPWCRAGRWCAWLHVLFDFGSTLSFPPPWHAVHRRFCTTAALSLPPERTSDGASITLLSARPYLFERLCWVGISRSVRSQIPSQKFFFSFCLLLVLFDWLLFTWPDVVKVHLSRYRLLYSKLIKGGRHPR